MQFPWVTYHWIAGIVLTVSILFHIIHATFCHGLLVDLAGQGGYRRRRDDGCARTGQNAPAPRRFAKYPLENKMYHGVIVLAGLAVISPASS